MATQKVKHMKRVGSHSLYAVPFLNEKRNGQVNSPANPVQLGTRSPQFRAPQFGRRRPKAAVMAPVVQPARPGVIEGVVVKVKRSRWDARKVAAIALAREVVETAIAEYRIAKAHIAGAQARGAH